MFSEILIFEKSSPNSSIVQLEMFFSYLATVHQNRPGPDFLPFTCLARHLWSSSLKFCYSYFNSTKPRWFTLLGLLGEKLILVNLNSESFPLKNILNDIKKFKINCVQKQQNLFSPQSLQVTRNSVFVKRYKFKSKFFWFGDRTVELNMKVFLYGSIRILPSFGNRGDGGGGHGVWLCPYWYTKLN